MDILVFVCEHCDREFESHLHRVEHKLDVSIELQEKILTAQEDVNAAALAMKDATATIVNVANDLVVAAKNIQDEIAALVASGTPVDTTALNDSVTAFTTALQPLKDAQTAVDALETPPVTPTP